MSYKQTKIKEWEKEHILEWIESIDNLSDKWTKQMIEIITQLNCNGQDLLSLKNGKELGESFGLENPMLSNRIFRELKNIKKTQSSNNNNKIIEFQINIFSQGQTLLLNNFATENTLISQVKQWYKQQYEINTPIDEIIFKSNAEILSDNKTLGFYNINNKHHLITVNFHTTAGGYPETLSNNWSQYYTMLTNIGFINIPNSIHEADEIWIQMLICIHNKTNNTPINIDTRQELIEILKEDGFYTNQINWFQSNCPETIDINNHHNNNNNDIDIQDNNNIAVENINQYNRYENGLFGDVFIRKTYIASCICLVSMLSFGVWFSKPLSNEFNIGYGLSAFGSVMLCFGSICSLIFICIQKIGIPIVKKKLINWIIICMYCIGGLFYFFGGCGITNAWNKLNNSSIAGVYFAEQIFVSIHGILAGYDLYKENILNNKKWRIIIYNSIFVFLSLIAFFSFAVISSTFDNGIIKFLATFYFLVMIPSICFIMNYLMPNMQQLFNKRIVIYVLVGLFIFCVICILIAHFMLTADFNGLFLGDRIGIFILLMAIIIISDMLFDRFINQNNHGDASYQGLPNQTR